ncbi:hypothetical protein EXIGLDRAFT_765445 [Exidia glandulosa HHB12029]|uniref:C2H2-type domain-containing protein n=1 Tax=Exidia glandulosa HHB12029 TaxID=1314781 RepID=A0A165KHL0_EXIGL|nr:hypothetical protein EXIGLDRAFT_765445 [Exidia glandulosa HHB12029]
MHLDSHPTTNFAHMSQGHFPVVDIAHAASTGDMLKSTAATPVAGSTSFSSTPYTFTNSSVLISTTGETTTPMPVPTRYHTPRPRKRRGTPLATAKRPQVTDNSVVSPPTSSSSSSVVEKWSCRVAGCTKFYGRTYDLVRHLDTAHHRVLRGADDLALLAAGTPPRLLRRLRDLLDKRYRCDVCGHEFSRKDTLSRHLDEQGHRPLDLDSRPSMPDSLPSLTFSPTSTTSSVSDFAPPSGPLLADYDSFPSFSPMLPFVDDQDDIDVPLFPVDLFNHVLSLCEGATPPSDEEVDREIMKMGLFA